MNITKIESLTKTISKVWVDYELAFTLSIKDIKKLELYEDKEISESDYNKIIEEIVIRGAKDKALNIIERSMKTEKEMKDRLKRSGYSEYVIERITSFLKEYKFIDDKNYAANYVKFNSKRKSKRQIQFELKKKGIDNYLIDEVLESYDDEVEGQIIDKYLEKFLLEDGTIPEEKFNKIAANLYRKGFKNSTILKKMRNAQKNQ